MTEETPAKPEKIAFTISASSIDLFQMCPRKYFYEQKYSSPFSKPEPLDQGSFLHRILEAFYRSYFHEDVKYSDRVEEAFRGQEEWAVLSTDLSLEKIQEVIKHAHDYLEYRSDDRFQVLEVEAPFSVPIYEDERYIVLLEGKVDLLVRDMRNDGMKLIIDHKKVSKQDEPGPMTNQQFCYSFIKQCPTVMLNCIGFQKTLPVTSRMHRFVHSYTDSQIGEWILNLHANLREMFLYFDQDPDFQDERVWPMKLNSCWKCGFAKYVCSSIPETRADKLSMFFGPKTAYDMFAQEVPND